MTDRSISAAEPDDDTLCQCGHELYLHDNGEDACAGAVGQPCDCPCLEFRRAE